MIMISLKPGCESIQLDSSLHVDLFNPPVESMNEEHIVMGANPVYAIKNSRPDDHNDDYETVQWLSSVFLSFFRTMQLLLEYNYCVLFINN